MLTKSNEILLGEYDSFLFEVIKNLDKYPSKKGGEGTAYFIGDNFVVKEYVKQNSCIEDEIFDELFQYYFEEMKEFAEKGFSVPRFYSWLKIPNPNRLLVRKHDHEMPFKYYVLQERVQGRNLYYDIDSIDESYDLIKHLCSFEDFSNMSDNLNFGDDALRVEILKTYILDYIMVNEMLESMPENELEKFIVSGHQMMLNGKYSVPDIYRGNVIIDSSKLSIIDNRVLEPDSGSLTWDNCNETLFNDMLLLLHLNTSARDSIFMLRVDFDTNEELFKLQKQNQKICAEVFKKIINIFKARLHMKPLEQNSLKKMYIKRILKEDSDEVLSMV